MAEPRLDTPIRPHRGLTAAIWAISLLCLAIAALLAAEFALVPVSLDIGEMINAGAGPWWDAAEAIGLFAALVVVAGVSLRLWHSARFKLVAWLLTAAEVACVGWAGFVVYRDYF